MAIKPKKEVVLKKLFERKTQNQQIRVLINFTGKGSRQVVDLVQRIKKQWGNLLNSVCPDDMDLTPYVAKIGLPINQCL